MTPRRLPAHALLLAPLVAAAGPSDLTLFVAPSGADSNSGRSEASPLRTLKQALAAAQAHAGKPGDIVVQFMGGDYLGDFLEVDWFPPGEQALVLDGSSATGQARFDGKAGSTTWLVVRGKPLTRTNLVVREFEVRNYRGAVAVYGDRFDRTPWSSGTRIENNRFENIGQFSASVKAAYGAITLSNAHANTVAGNVFRNIRNIVACDGLHAIYLSGGASHNTITKNRFDGGCGDTIKTRDRSNFNVIRDNVFIGQEGKALFVDSFCDRRKTAECRDKQQECPSWGNAFHDNDIDESSVRPGKAATRTVGSSTIPNCPVPDGSPARIIHGSH